jgi:phosphoglycerate dehydrogenase-like enzyme
MTRRNRKLVLCIAPGAQPPPGWESIADQSGLVIARGREEVQAQLVDAAGLFLWDFTSRVLDGRPLPAALEWIHTASLGVDAVLTPEVIASSITVSNTRGLFERPIAEYVLGLMLAIAKDFRATFRHQERGEWRWRLARSLVGHEVALIGPGAIGREIHAMLAAMGCHVHAFGRRDIEDDPVFGRIRSLVALEAALPAADTAILALPLTDATRGVFGARLLSCMKPGSTLINIGRGALVDEEALLAALRRGRPALAALDVFMQEPLPPGHPFWAMDQVIISPHMSSDVIGWERKAVEQFAANLARWRAGETLVNVLDKPKFRLSPPVR